MDTSGHLHATATTKDKQRAQVLAVSIPLCSLHPYSWCILELFPPELDVQFLRCMRRCKFSLAKKGIFLSRVSCVLRLAFSIYPPTTRDTIAMADSACKLALEAFHDH